VLVAFSAFTGSLASPATAEKNVEEAFGGDFVGDFEPDNFERDSDDFGDAFGDFEGDFDLSDFDLSAFAGDLGDGLGDGFGLSAFDFFGEVSAFDFFVEVSDFTFLGVVSPFDFFGVVMVFDLEGVFGVPGWEGGKREDRFNALRTISPGGDKCFREQKWFLGSVSFTISLTAVMASLGAPRAGSFSGVRACRLGGLTIVRRHWGMGMRQPPILHMRGILT
jgi:hypothetical protein